MSEYLCLYYNTEVQALSTPRLSPVTPCRPSPPPVTPGLTDSISGQGSLSLSSECDPSFLHVLSLAQLGAQPEPRNASHYYCAHILNYTITLDLVLSLWVPIVVLPACPCWTA